MWSIETDFIQIKKQGIYSYGGNQEWWKDDNQSLEKYGCGVVAMCNMEICLKNTFEKIKDNTVSFDIYKELLTERFNQNYHFCEIPPFNALGLLPSVMKKGLNQFFKQYNRNYKIMWAPTIKKDEILSYINRMLSQNIPITASYYVFNKKNKLDFYICDELNKSMLKKDGCTSHYFNITGIIEIKEDIGGTTYFLISSWGKKYYIKVEDWIKKLSYFTNILYIETYFESDIIEYS